MKIGIITMHRVQNIGSVLQAYALQHKLFQLGYDSELIDYIFPPKTQKYNSLGSIMGHMWNALQGFPIQKSCKKLNLFRNKYLKCSSQSYSKESINNNPPEYDIFCTGSDQVWNPKHVGNDTTFMLDFAPSNSPRIAFASSFATNTIPQDLEKSYSYYLSQYQSITVREQSGISLVKKLTGKDASVVCDPTLLLNAEEWNDIGENSSTHLKKGYILVYLLRYMFDPRPHIYSIVENTRKSLGLPVYYFGGGLSEARQPHAKVLSGLGAEEFVSLIKNASFLITDSFHGTAFASIFNIPMLGIVKDTNTGAGRIATLRQRINGDGSIVKYDDIIVVNPTDIDKYKCDELLVDKFRNDSSAKLQSMIKPFDK